MADQVSQGFLSPALQRARLNAVRPWLRGQVLDIGCGSGALAAFVAAEDYTGFDPDQASIDVARRNFPAHRFTTELPQGQYDTVAALALLEHLPEPQQALRDWTARLAPGGRIVLTTPHRLFRLAHEIGAGLRLFSRDAAAEHETMFDRAGLAALAAAAGLAVIRYQRFLFGANQLVVLR